MSGYIPPGRVRQIARLSVEVEILRNKIAALTVDLRGCLEMRPEGA
jgi:hypothetical protein